MARGRRPRQAPPEWNFLSFPVFFAFVTAVFLATTLVSLEAGGLAGSLHFTLWVVSLLGTSFGCAHTITHYFVRRRERAERERAEEEERERRALAARAAREETAEERPVRRRRRRR